MPMPTATELSSVPTERPTAGGARLNGATVGWTLLLVISVPCFLTLPWSLSRYNTKNYPDQYAPPTWANPMGTDGHGRSVMWRCLLGGAISLSIGVAAAVISVAIGVAWGAVAGLAGGRTDAFLMRTVDILYGLPYILLVVLIDIALGTGMQRTGEALGLASDTAKYTSDVVTLLIAIGGVSWLTMARVIRGQVLSLRAQPFVEASRACGAGTRHILRRHLLPNLVGPIVVYATLSIPAAILAESFLSFLGIGVEAPLPSWGNLASEGIKELNVITGFHHWWLLVWPCVLLGLTLMGLNFAGDALRDRMDPTGERT